MAEGPVRYLGPVSPRYFVRSAKMDSLVDPDVDYIVSHIRKALIGFRLGRVDEGARY